MTKKGFIDPFNGKAYSWESDKMYIKTVGSEELHLNILSEKAPYTVYTN